MRGEDHRLKCMRATRRATSRPRRTRGWSTRDRHWGGAKSFTFKKNKKIKASVFGSRELKEAKNSTPLSPSFFSDGGGGGREGSSTRARSFARSHLGGALPRGGGRRLAVDSERHDEPGFVFLLATTRRLRLVVMCRGRGGAPGGNIVF